MRMASRLALIVPFVEGVVEVEALEALQPDQGRAARAGQGLGDLRLAHAGVALHQQRGG